jgi:hypothetical protein
VIDFLCYIHFSLANGRFRDFSGLGGAADAKRPDFFC